MTCLLFVHGSTGYAPCSYSAKSRYSFKYFASANYGKIQYHLLPIVLMLSESLFLSKRVYLVKL